MAAAVDARGREADRPGEIPSPGWKDIAKRVKSQIKEDKLSIIAAAVAFYGLLSVFPALVALVAIYGLVADPAQVESQVQSMSGVLPPQAAEILLAQLSSLVSTSATALGFGAIAGVVVALWSASGAVRTLMEALNIAYGEEEKRGFIRFYGTALLLTLAAIVGVILAIALVVALPAVLGLVGLSSVVDVVVRIVRWPLLALLAVLGFAIMYRYGPSRRSARWRWLSAGAFVGVALWIVGSALFSLYVTRFGSYNETYGAAGAVVILLMWFLLSSYAILIGAEINAEMERQTKKDTTTPGGRPMGARKAYAADTIGGSE